MSRFSLFVAAGVALALGPSAHAQRPVYLQSFIAPSDAAALQAFTFGGLTASDPITFGLYGFDGAHLTTSALWSQAVAGPLDTRDIVALSPNVAVLGSGQYAIGAYTGTELGATARADILEDGRFYLVDGDGYTATFGEQDADGFSVTFDTITTPEPASLALLATGLAGVAFVRRRRANTV
jgi:hypothetical protein